MLIKTMYLKDAKGQIREWRIDGETEFDTGYLLMTYGLLNGEKITKVEEVYENMSGRDIEEQTLLRFNSRVSKMRDKGYVDSIEEARKGATNMLGMPKPMLAQKFKSVRNIDYSSAYAQRKYDGNRCLIANCDGEIIAYTRNGKRIDTIPHITSNADIPNGTILDGELYAHGESLQTIVSWIKRKQEKTKQLKYHVYDMIHEDAFPDRLSRLADFDLGSGISLVETAPLSSAEEAAEHLSLYRSEGYEGAIIRWGNWGYEDGKRSKSLVKMKEWNDREFVVEAITASKDGWAILHMTCGLNLEFKASAPGTIDQKIETYMNRHNYIGRLVTIEYAYLTADGIPFHPIAKAWRT